MLTLQNVESELSYAYLHAVASICGFSCKQTNRHMDDACIDVEINEEGRFLIDDSILSSFTLHVQLKATYQELAESEEKISFILPIKQYNKLRATRRASPLILILLKLPKEKNDWLNINNEELVIKKCAYWVSLRGAIESTNKTDQTIYIPKNQLITIDSFNNIMISCSKQEELNYDQ